MKSGFQKEKNVWEPNLGIKMSDFRNLVNTLQIGNLKPLFAQFRSITA